jgi:hypothetical protein
MPYRGHAFIAIRAMTALLTNLIHLNQTLIFLSAMPALLQTT